MRISTRRILSPLFLASLVAMLAACGPSEAGAGEGTGGEPSGQAMVHDSVTENRPAANKPAKPIVIGQGETVDLDAQASIGNYTVFDFTSEYCGPCRRIAPYLDKLHAGRPDVTVVKVDINRPGVRGIDWGSPTARQFGLNSIPHFKVFDQEGTQIAEGQPAWDLVVKWIMALEEQEATPGR